MAGKNRSGKAWKDYYNAAKSLNKSVKNRTTAIEKHLDQHPNDDVAAKAVKSVSYRRYTPNNKLGWTYSAFKNVDKKLRTEQIVTKQQCFDWAQAFKIRKKTENAMRHLTKVERNVKQAEALSTVKNKNIGRK